MDTTAERVITHVETPIGGIASGGWYQNYRADSFTIADWDKFIWDTVRLLGIERAGYRCVARNEYGETIAMHVFD